MIPSQKIAFVVHGLNLGGAEKFMISLINHFLKNDCEVVLYLLSNEMHLLHEIDERVKVDVILRKYRFDFTASFRLKQKLLNDNIDKIVCINTYSFFFVKLGLLFNKNFQVYLSVHSTIPTSLKNYVQNFLYFKLLQKNDTVIYLCENQKQYLKKNYFLNHHNDYVINNGVDTLYFNPVKFQPIDRYLYRMSFNLKHNEKVILKVARLSPEKGHHDAIEALYLLHDKYKEKAHLFFVGDGKPEYVNELKNYVIDRGLQDFVHFEGNKIDVRKYYLIADLFTLTSYNTETFSLAALEAMAFGLPCSLTEIGGASEMHLSGLTGILTRPHDPLNIADSWYNLLTRQPKKEKIRQFVLDKFEVSQMLAYYQKILFQPILNVS